MLRASKPKTLKRAVRSMTAGDVGAILAILRNNFPLERWNETKLYQFCNPDEKSYGTVQVATADDTGEVAAVLLAKLTRRYLRVCAIATADKARRQGYALSLIAASVGRTGLTQRSRFMAVVHERNTPAQLLFKKAGFTGTIPSNQDENEHGNKSYVFRKDTLKKLNAPAGVRRNASKA